MLKSKVTQVQILDEEGYWMKRTVFIISDNLNDAMNIFTGKIMKRVPQTYTTTKEVLHV